MNMHRENRNDLCVDWDVELGSHSVAERQSYGNEAGGFWKPTVRLDYLIEWLQFSNVQ